MEWQLTGEGGRAASTKRLDGKVSEQEEINAGLAEGKGEGEDAVDVEATKERKGDVTATEAVAERTRTTDR